MSNSRSGDLGTVPAPTGRSVGRAASRRTGRRAQRATLSALMVSVSLAMLYPFYFVIRTSFQSNQQFLAGSGQSLASWLSLTSQLPWAQELVNSAIVTGCSVAIIVVVSSWAGFAFAKLRYSGSRFVFLVIISAMLIPVASIIIPVYVNAARLHLLNSYTAAIIAYAALGTPFGTLLMTAYFRGLPDELIEAGRMDGLSFAAIYRRILLPLSAPAIATVVVLQFVQIWDDLLVGLLLLQNSSERTITVGLGVLASGKTADIPVLMAASMVSAIPALAVFLVFQRYFVAGLTAGIDR